MTAPTDLYWQPVQVIPMDTWNFTISNSQQVSKGVMLQLNDERTAIPVVAGALAATATGEPMVGVAVTDHAPGDGTEIAVWRRGIFDAVASGAIKLGTKIIAVADGLVAAAKESSLGINASGAIIIGHALGVAADQERIQVWLNL